MTPAYEDFYEATGAIATGDYEPDMRLATPPPRMGPTVDELDAAAAYIQAAAAKFEADRSDA